MCVCATRVGGEGGEEEEEEEEDLSRFQASKSIGPARPGPGTGICGRKLGRYHPFSILRRCDVSKIQVNTGWIHLSDRPVGPETTLVYIYADGVGHQAPYSNTMWCDMKAT